jgi:hypothetical protein
MIAKLENDLCKGVGITGVACDDVQPNSDCEARLRPVNGANSNKSNRLSQVRCPSVPEALML